jgi:hypothetical protein
MSVCFRTTPPEGNAFYPELREDLPPRPENRSGDQYLPPVLFGLSAALFLASFLFRHRGPPRRYAVDVADWERRVPPVIKRVLRPPDVEEVIFQVARRGSGIRVDEKMVTLYRVETGLGTLDCQQLIRFRFDRMRVYFYEKIGGRQRRDALDLMPRGAMLSETFFSWGPKTGWTIATH